MARAPAPKAPARRPGAWSCAGCGSTLNHLQSCLTPVGYLLLSAAAANAPLSIWLMDGAGVGYATIFATPLIAVVGLYECRRQVVVCSSCGRQD